MQKYTFAFLTFLLPLFFCTLTINAFTTPKILLLALISILLILNWTRSLLITQTLTLSSANLRFGLLAFALSIILNLLLYPEGRLESFLGPGIIYLLLCLWTYFLTMSPSRSVKSFLLYALLLSSSLLALHSLLQITFFSQLSILPTFMQTRLFTPSGDEFTTFIFLIIGAALSLNLIFSQPKFKPLFIISSMLHIAALVSLGFLIFPSSTSLLPLKASLSIARAVIKTTKTLLFGVGLANFPIFFKSVKPLFLNATPFWNHDPLTSGSQLLQIFTTTGILGLGSFLILPILTFTKLHFHKDDLPLILTTILSGLGLIFTPGSLPILLVFFTGIGLLSASPPKSLVLSKVASSLLACLLLIATAYFGYQLSRPILAEFSMYQARLAFKNSDGKKIFEKNLAAIKYLPLMTNYHLALSQVNLSLAGALSQKASLSDLEKSKVAEFISQAIKEAKTAIALRPSDSSTWQNLGFIYHNLISSTEGLDQLAIQAYTQAISLDPANPALRVELAGLLYQLANLTKNNDQSSLLASAAIELKTAISLKPDYFNAYYSLAKISESSGDYPGAITNLEKAITLLSSDSPEFARTNLELETLKSTNSATMKLTN